MVGIVIGAASVPLALPLHLGARVQSTVAAPLPIAQTPPAVVAPPDVTQARDPFVPDAAVVDLTGHRVGGASVDLRLTAIALGAQPHALVQQGDRTQIVRVGDALAGSSVSGIDERGVSLANGTLLTLEGGAP